MKEVLVIEDDADISALIELHLLDIPCHVVREENGRRGYEEAQKHQYDLIVLDIMLPEMDGLAICTQLRRKKDTTPIIMLTAKSEEIDRILGLESGADMYIPKPFSIIEFKSNKQNSQIFILLFIII